jgi:hypothetical protein
MTTDLICSCEFEKYTCSSMGYGYFIRQIIMSFPGLNSFHLGVLQLFILLWFSSIATFLLGFLLSVQICWLIDLKSRGALVIATPYASGFDHFFIADEVQFKFDRCLRNLDEPVSSTVWLMTRNTVHCTNYMKFDTGKWSPNIWCWTFLRICYPHADWWEFTMAWISIMFMKYFLLSCKFISTNYIICQPII